MSRQVEGFATISAQAMALLDPLPTIDLTPRSADALTRGVIRVQERLQIEPYILPTLSDLLIVAKYAQMNANVEFGAGRDASALVWARVALRLWDDAVKQSLTGAAILDLLGRTTKR